MLKLRVARSEPVADRLGVGEFGEHPDPPSTAVGVEATRPNSSIQSAPEPAPAATAPARTGCGSRKVGRRGPDGNSPDGVLGSTLPTPGQPGLTGGPPWVWDQLGLASGWPPGAPGAPGRPGLPCGLDQPEPLDGADQPGPVGGADQPRPGAGPQPR